jgi:CubicO group peptidase (beta-lactamase class C family)
MTDRKLEAALAALSSFLLVASASAQDAAGADRRTRLNELCDRVELRLMDACVPGMALVVVAEGEIVLSQGFGVSDWEEETPVTEETVFPLGSSTKPFTATLAAILVSEGTLSWDDPVTDYLPWFRLPIDCEDEEAQVTIRDLLSHRTGFDSIALTGKVLSWWTGLPREEGDPEVWTREAMLRAMLELEPAAPFREKHHYSNASMVAAALASAVAAQDDWDTLMQERMFAPLGMGDTTTLFEPTLEHPQLATGYLVAGGECEAVPLGSMDVVSPAGGMSANMRDLGVWLRMLLNDGVHEGERLIAHEALHEMWTSQVDGAEMGGMFPGADYGLSWFVREWQGHELVEHGGNGRGFSAQIALLPELGHGFAMLSNALPNPLQYELNDMVWEALVGAE